MSQKLTRVQEVEEDIAELKRNGIPVAMRLADNCRTLAAEVDAVKAELKRRLNSIVDYSGRLMKGVGEYENGYNKAMAEIRAVAIAEGQDNRHRPHRPDGLLKD